MRGDENGELIASLKPRPMRTTEMPSSRKRVGSPMDGSVDPHVLGYDENTLARGVRHVLGRNGRDVLVGGTGLDAATPHA